MWLMQFEVGRWSMTAPTEARTAMLAALREAATRWGAAPESRHHILLEVRCLCYILYHIL